MVSFRSSNQSFRGACHIVHIQILTFQHIFLNYCDVCLAFFPLELHPWNLVSLLSVFCFFNNYGPFQSKPATFHGLSNHKTPKCWTAQFWKSHVTLTASSDRFSHTFLIPVMLQHPLIRSTVDFLFKKKKKLAGHGGAHHWFQHWRGKSRQIICEVGVQPGLPSKYQGSQERRI